MWLMSLSHAGSLKTEYKHEAAMLTADMDLALSALNASAVVGQKVTSILVFHYYLCNSELVRAGLLATRHASTSASLR